MVNELEAEVSFVSSQIDPPSCDLLGRANATHSDNPVISKDFLFRIVAGVFHVDVTLLDLPTRGRASTALARQAAMYLAHVSFGLTLTEVGELFCRDRTTVAHACARIEDRREDQDFDATISMLERSVRLVFVSSPAYQRELAQKRETGSY